VRNRGCLEYKSAFSPISDFEPQHDHPSSPGTPRALIITPRLLFHSAYQFLDSQSASILIPFLTGYSGVVKGAIWFVVLRSQRSGSLLPWKVFQITIYNTRIYFKPFPGAVPDARVPHLFLGNVNCRKYGEVFFIEDLPNEKLFWTYLGVSRSKQSMPTHHFATHYPARLDTQLFGN
jgi:hypothetical protein